MPAEQWLPEEEVVDAPGVPKKLRAGRPVEVPLEELAFVTEEDLPAVLDPDALNCGNLVDIYQEREADFKNLSRLEVNYVDAAGEQARETLFVLDMEMVSFTKGTPRICMSMDVCRAMRRAIEVLTRKVDNLSMTLKSCRAHYLKELTYLRNCRETNEHNAAWFSPHVYEDNFTKIEIRRRLSLAAEEWKDERAAKNKEIQLLRERLAHAGNDDTSIVNRFKLALKTIPLDQSFFFMKQSVENDEAKEASFYGHLERLLAERQQEQGETPSKKGQSDKEVDNYIQHIEDLSAQLGDAQARISELESEAAWDKLQTDTMTPVKPERPSSGKSRRQAHRSVITGHDWKAVVASMENENGKLRKQIEDQGPQIAHLEEQLSEMGKELDYKRELLRAKEHDYQHLNQELNSVRRQLQILKSESKKGSSKPPPKTSARKGGKLSRAQSGLSYGGLKPPEDEGWATTSRDSLVSGGSSYSLHSLHTVSDTGDVAPPDKKTKPKPKFARSSTTRVSDASKMENRRSSHSSRRSSKQDSSSEDNTGTSRDDHIPSGFQMGPTLSFTFAERRPKQVLKQAVTTVMTCQRVLRAVFPRWTLANKKRAADKELYTWTNKGLEWAKSTSSFVMLPGKGTVFSPSHNALLRGMGRSVWTSLLAGHLEKMPESNVTPDMVNTEENTEFIWTPRGVEWALSNGNFTMLPENASKVTEEQLGLMQESGGCAVGSLAQVCGNSNYSFVWTAEGIDWARTTRAFPSPPEPGTQVSEEHLQLIRALGGCPHGCISLDSLAHAQATEGANQKSETLGTTGDAYRWTAEGVEWIRTSGKGKFPVTPLKDALVTDDEFQILRIMGGAPRGCITSRRRRNFTASGKSSLEPSSDWKFDSEMVPPTMYDPPDIIKEDTAVSQSEAHAECPIDLVFGELGELGDVPEEEEMERDVTREGTGESRRSSLTKGQSKARVDVAAQTILSFDLSSPSWSCLTDLDGGYQQEGVLHGTLRPGAYAKGECIELFGEAEEEKAVLCSRSNNSIIWSKTLPSDFVVESRIKVLETGGDAVVFAFGSGQQLDLVRIDGNGRAISLEGSHWGYIDDGRSTPLRSQAWSTLKFERKQGEMTLDIDGVPVLQNVPMNWSVDAMQWQPKQNTIGIAYLKAWPAMGFHDDRLAQEALLQRVQLELRDWCQNYLHAHGGGRRPLSAQTFRSHGSFSSDPGSPDTRNGRDSFGIPRRKSGQPYNSRRCSLEETTVCEDDRYFFEEDDGLSRRVSLKSDAKQLRSLIDSRFSSLHGTRTSMQTNWSSTRSRTRDHGGWRAKTAQGGISGRNAATILNTLSHKRQSCAPDDEVNDEEEVQLSLGGTYMGMPPLLPR